ncbi:MAG: biotin/lipoyl-binding protein [Clostridia bacterium]
MLKVFKNFTVKKIVILSVIIVAIAVGVVAFFVINNNASSVLDGEILYMEETVAKTDIVVGVAESGNASLDTVDVEVESGMTVEEILVSAGQYVEAGEVIAVLNLEDYEEYASSDLSTLSSAELEQSNLSMEIESKMIEAQATYDKTIASGESAATVYSLEISEINQTLTDYNSDISDVNEDIDDIEYQIKYGLTSDYGLADAKSAVTTQEAVITSLEEQIAALELLIEEEAALVATVIDDGFIDETTGDETTGDETTGDVPVDDETTGDMTGAEEVVTNEEKLLALQESLQKAEEELTSLNSSLEKTQEEYDTAYDALDGQLESLESQLTSLSTSRSKYITTMDTLKIQAQEEYDLSIASYNNADTVYDNTVSSLETSLESGQETIDELTEAIYYVDEDATLIIDESGNVLAPCTGYIMSVQDNSSSTMANVSPLIISIADSSYCSISVSLDQEDIGDVEVGMDVNVVFDAYETLTIPAYVSEIEITTSSGISASVSYTVTIMCELPEETSDGTSVKIYHGMSSTATFVLKQMQDVLAVSSKCITTEDGVEYASVLNDDGTVEQIEVVTGFSDGFDVEITSGLSEGDVVVIESAVSANAR